MQDKEIRKILIEYLKIQHEDHRIYQEKNIGTAVCDVMLVTDHLSGFEIKSDCDNYERLPRQVHAYDLMFDKNYIAVGVSHINSIKTKVPTHWGILAVDSSGIRSIREAKRNKSVKRTHQLNLLWKLELKNLLLKNQLPVYAQKSKAFLRDVISREVPTDTLGPQIATELLNRDESLFDEAEAKTADNAEGYLETSLPIICRKKIWSLLRLINGWLFIDAPSTHVSEKRLGNSKSRKNTGIRSVLHIQYHTQISRRPSACRGCQQKSYLSLR